MNKQIEEMAKVIDEFTEPLSSRDIHKAEFSEQFAEHLYNADYRKASDVAREIFGAIYGISIGCSVENDVMRLTFEKEPYVLVVLASEFDKLRKKYESEGTE